MKWGNHVSVYLPAFDHRLLVQKFTQIPEKEWHIFSPNCNEMYWEKNVRINPVGSKPFLDSMKSNFGVITGAGFETCAEAMFLGKKLLSIPISNQYEQYCNAAALEKIGIQSVRVIDNSFVSRLRNWIDHTKSIQLQEIADSAKLVDLLMNLSANNDRGFSSDDLLEVQQADAYSSVPVATP